MRRELTTEEKRWCLDQAIALVKEVARPRTRSRASTILSAPCTKRFMMTRKSRHKKPINGYRM
jgi:hypothetical protein